MKKFTFLILSFFVALTTYAADYDQLYVVGDGCDAGWDPNKAIEMTSTGDGTFTWTGTLYDNTGARRFKFLVARAWETSITCRLDEDSHLVTESGQEYDLYVRTNNGYDNAFQVAATGNYTINIDLNTMKMQISAAVQEEKPELAQLFLTGSATNEENPISMTKLSEGIFIWNGELYTGEEDAPGEFFFLNESGTSDKVINARGSDIDVELASMYNLKFRPLAADPDDYKFKIAEPGNYTIQVNLNTMKMKFMQIDYDNLFIVGNALNGKAEVWSMDDAIAMTKVETGVFTWTGTLYAKSTENDFICFKFINQKEEDNWANDFIFDETQAGNKDITEVGEYTISYHIGGSDNKFEVTEEGTYTIEVDLYAMTLSVVKEGSGVKSVWNNETPFVLYANNGFISVAMKNGAVAGDIQIFDVTGKVVAKENKLNAGIYIVRVTCNNNTYAAKITVK